MIFKLYPRTLGDCISLLVVPIWLFVGVTISVHLCYSAWLKSNAWFLDSPQSQMLMHIYIMFNISLFAVAWIQFQVSRPHKFGFNFYAGLFSALYLIFVMVRPWAFT